MSERQGVLIIGGGIIGHSISYYLNKSGVSTTVIDKQGSGRKATKAAAGMLGVHSENFQADVFYKFCERSRQLYQSLSQELFRLTSINIGLSQTGMIEMALEAEEKNKLRVKKTSFPELEWLEGENLSEKVPSLHGSGAVGLHMKEDGHVEPVHVCEAFKRAALQYGGKVIEDQSVWGIEKLAQGYSAQLANDTLSADRIVIAAGAESGPWFEATGIEDPMVPTKGEYFSIKPQKNAGTKTLFFSDFYIVPKPDGRCVIGATTKSYDNSHFPTAGGLSELMNRVFSVFPTLQGEPLQDYGSGVRPGTKDGLPIIGEHPTMAGLYFATGHYRNGILLAPATGELVKDLILDKKPDSSITQLLSPSRLVRKGEHSYEHSN